MNKTIWLARHGNRLDFVKPEWLKTCDRFYDPPLSEDGIQQAKKLGQYLKGKGISHIFSSPFRRTVETANYVTESLNLPIKIESGLSEMLFPLGMPSESAQFSVLELALEFPRIDLNYTSRIITQYPEMSWQQLVERVGETVRCLVDEFAGDILLVSHDVAIIGAISRLVEGKPKVNASTLCCLFKLVKINQKWVIEMSGETPHLTESEAIRNPSPFFMFTYYSYLIQRTLRRLK